MRYEKPTLNKAVPTIETVKANTNTKGTGGRQDGPTSHTNGAYEIDE